MSDFTHNCEKENVPRYEIFYSINRGEYKGTGKKHSRAGMKKKVEEMNIKKGIDAYIYDHIKEKDVTHYE